MAVKVDYTWTVRRLEHYDDSQLRYEMKKDGHRCSHPIIVGLHSITTSLALQRLAPANLRNDTEQSGLAPRLDAKMKQFPNTGSLEGDLRELFDWTSTLLTSMHYTNIICLMREQLGGISMRDYFDKFARNNFLSQMVRTFFEHASDREEVISCTLTRSFTISLHWSSWMPSMRRTIQR